MDDKMLKLSEFAEFCGTTRDTLLWYDKMGILKPAAVGENGYRYYSPKQFFDYDLISTLKRTGSSLREIAENNRERSYTELREFFMAKSELLSRQIDELHSMKRLIDSINDSIETTLSCDFDKPELVWEEKEYLAVTMVPDGFGWFQESAEPFVRRHIRSYADIQGVERHPLGTVIDMSALYNYDDVPVELRYFYRAEQGALENLEEKPEGYYVRVFHRGSYDGIRDSFSAAFKFMSENGLKAAGDIYEYDILSHLLLDSEKDFVYKLLIPVEKEVENT